MGELHRIIVGLKQVGICFAIKLYFAKNSAAIINAIKFLLDWPEKNHLKPRSVKRLIADDKRRE